MTRFEEALSAIGIDKYQYELLHDINECGKSTATEHVFIFCRQLDVYDLPHSNTNWVIENNNSDVLYCGSWTGARNYLIRHKDIIKSFENMGQPEKTDQIKRILGISKSE